MKSINMMALSILQKNIVLGINMKNNKPELYIIVEGGIVLSVCHNIDDLEFQIIDWDNAESDLEEEKRCNELAKKADKMPYKG